MNERTWWAKYVRPKWHQPTKGWVSWKVQDHVFKGLPDALVKVGVIAALIECKYDQDSTIKRDGTVAITKDVAEKGLGMSPEQRNHLEEWVSTGGYGFVFFGLGRDGYLVPFHRCPKEGMMLEQLQERAVVYCLGYAQFGKVMDYIAELNATHING